MNVLTNKDNSAADIVGVNNRNVRKHNIIGGYNVDELAVSNPFSNYKLLMDGTKGYSVENRNKLSGSYRNNVKAVNNEELIVKNPYVKDTFQNRNNNVNKNSMLNVPGYNNKGLNETHPFPGNVVNTPKLFQKSNLNVGGYNSSALQHMRLNSNNVVENFQNNVANNAVNNVANNVASCHGLPYSTEEQLRKAQNRSISCNSNPLTKAPVASVNSPNHHSSQGYGHSSGVSGFNEYGADAINYLCLSRDQRACSIIRLGSRWLLWNI